MRKESVILSATLVCIAVVLSTILNPTIPTPKLIHRVTDSVVKIESEFGYGSGVIIGKEKQEDLNLYYVLTAYHLIIDPSPFAALEQALSSSEPIKLIVTSYNNNEEIIGINNATFHCGDLKLDSIIITFLSSRDLPVSPISVKYNIMDEVFTSTFQLSAPIAVTRGIISRLTGMFIVSDAEISPGSSGGGLFIKRDDQYFLIGMADQVAFENGILFTHCAYFVSSRSFVKFLKFNAVPCTIE